MKEIRIILLTLLALVFGINDMKGLDTITVDSLLYEIKLPERVAWCIGFPSSDGKSLSEHRRRVPHAVIANTVMYNGVEYPVTAVDFNVPRRDYSGVLKTIVIGDSVKTIMEKAFEYQKNLESVEFGKSVIEIGYAAFIGCQNLKSVTLPEGLKEIGGDAFRGCFSLESISLPTSIERVKYQAFDVCTSLTTVIIPNTMSELKFYAAAFGHCKNLRTVYCHQPTPPEVIPVYNMKNVFTSYFTDDSLITRPGRITLHVPKGCYEAYANSTSWNMVGKIVDDLGLTSGLDDLTVSEAVDDARSLEVYNLQGQKVGFDTSSLPKGIYIIRQGAVTEKRIVR